MTTAPVMSFTQQSLVEALDNVRALHDLGAELIAESVFSALAQQPAPTVLEGWVCIDPDGSFGEIQSSEDDALDLAADCDAELPPHHQGPAHRVAAVYIAAAPAAPAQMALQAGVSAHPMQPIEGDRFKRNAIVDHLLDYTTAHGHGLNELAAIDFSDEDRMQLAQLIGYSVSGYGDLSYASAASVERADAIVATMATFTEDPAGDCPTPYKSDSQLLTEALERETTMHAEVEQLQQQVGTLQSDANSWQSGYDKGRHDGDRFAREEREALRKDAERYRFVSQLAWYVDRAAQVYDVGNQSAQWADDRQSVDADDVEGAIDAAMEAHRCHADTAGDTAGA